MNLGIVGLSNVGKSTSFNAITKTGTESASYPLCTIEPNVGVVSVSDKKLDVLEEMYNTKKKVYTAAEFYDVAGLVKSASKGRGLGNKSLSHIREASAAIYVVGCFGDGNAVHVKRSVDPIRDIETINLELIFADLEALERRMERSTEQVRSGDKKAREEYTLMEKVKAHLEKDLPTRTLEVTEEEEELIKGLFLVTSKPTLYVCNISGDDMMEGDTSNEYVQKVRAHAEDENSEVVVVCTKLEEELPGLEDEEKQEMLSEYGLTESGLDEFIRASYKLLGLVSYLTAGVQEVRAWAIKEGTKAPQVTGKIRSDIERGSIRAEIALHSDLVECGSEAAAKEKGLYRLESKEYVTKDGDVVNFRFNV